MLMAVLTLMELMKLGVTQHGVDRYFYDLANSEGKAVQGLETVDEQIDHIVSMADGAEDEFVTHSLREMKAIKQRFETLTQAWRSGDADTIDALMVATVKTQQPKLYRRLIVERNNNWLPAITASRAKPRTALVLVGMAHLVGADGLLEALKKKGYRIQKL
jgi:hypothetical protein